MIFTEQQKEAMRSVRLRIEAEALTAALVAHAMEQLQQAEQLRAQAVVELERSRELAKKLARYTVGLMCHIINPGLAPTDSELEVIDDPEVRAVIKEAEEAARKELEG